MPDQGDLILIPIPYTDLTMAKQRPAIVISNDAYHARTQDLVIVSVTSQMTAAPYSFVIEQKDMDTGTLLRTSRVRVDKIYTLSQTVVVRVFGKAKVHVLDQIRAELTDLVASKGSKP